MINYERFIPLTKETKMGEIQVIKDSIENKTYANVYSICDLMNTINDKMMFYRTTIDKRIVELEEENEKLRRLFEKMKQPITINLTKEDEKELRKLLGLVDDG